MRRFCCYAMVFCAGAFLAGQMGSARAQGDDAAIQALVAGEVAAWNAHDAQAFSARFMEDGSFTNIIGMASFGKAPFLQQHQRIFSGIYKQSRVEMTISRIKMLHSDVALVDADTVLKGYTELPPGISAGADGALHTKLQMVLLLRADGWWIASFHNVAVAQLAMPPRP